MQELDFTWLIDNVIKIIQDNIIPVLILLVFIVYVLYSKVRESNNPRTKNIHKYWQAVQKHSLLISKNFQATIADIDHPAFAFKGSLYKIDSETYDDIREREYPVELSQEDLERIKAQELVLDENSKTKIIEQDGKFYVYQTYRVIEKRKSETAVAMIPTLSGGQIIAIRRSGLRETESILSEVEEIPLIELDPELSKGHLKLIMMAMVVYLALMTYFIFTQTEPTLLFSNTAWPWYILLLVVWIAKMKIDNEKIGRKILYRGQQIADESFSLKDHTGDEKTVLTVPVYEVTIHYHPAIATKNLLAGIGKEEIYDDTLKTLQRRVTKLSAEKASLEARLEQSHEIQAHKDAQLVAARLEHLQSFDDGFISGYARYHVALPESESQIPYADQRKGTTSIEWFREFKLPLMILMILGAGYFIFQGISTAISDASLGGSVNIFGTNTLIGLAILLVGLFTFIRFTK